MSAAGTRGPDRIRQLLDSYVVTSPQIAQKLRAGSELSVRQSVSEVFLINAQFRLSKKSLHGEHVIIFGAA